MIIIEFLIISYLLIIEEGSPKIYQKTQHSWKNEFDKPLKLQSLCTTSKHLMKDIECSNFCDITNQLLKL